MTGIRSREPGARSQESEPRFSLTPVSRLLIPLLLAVPIFGHGCHRGDHDDEPVFAPPPERVAELEPQR